MYKDILKKFLNSNKKFLNEKRVVDISPEYPSVLLERLSGKVKNPKYEWSGNLLKRIFIIRVFGFELSLFKEVKND